MSGEAAALLESVLEPALPGEDAPSSSARPPFLPSNLHEPIGMAALMAPMQVRIYLLLVSIHEFDISYLEPNF